jgi:hypothetical protein
MCGAEKLYHDGCYQTELARFRRGEESLRARDEQRGQERARIFKSIWDDEWRIPTAVYFVAGAIVCIILVVVVGAVIMAPTTVSGSIASTPREQRQFAREPTASPARQMVTDDDAEHHDQHMAALREAAETAQRTGVDVSLKEFELSHPEFYPHAAREAADAKADAESKLGRFSAWVEKPGLPQAVVKTVGYPGLAAGYVAGLVVGGSRGRGPGPNNK